MILYDEKLNFLGMSEHTLSFLGYEDIADFTSMQNDVADLFVKKEGYIYKFDNFSWIDFILYSGSATKKAIIRLKNGQETNIDITIKEIFLYEPINENKKFYSVKLISDSFHKISGVPKETKTMGGFSLNHLLNTDDTKQPINQKTTEKKSLEVEHHKNFILDTPQESTNEKKIENKHTQVLDFLNTPAQEKQPIMETKENKTTDDNFKIDFISKDNKTKIDINTPPPIQQSNTKKEVKQDNISLNFLKVNNDNEKLDIKPNLDIKNKTPQEDKLKQEERKLKLNFLKSEEDIENKDKIQKQTPSQIPDNQKEDSNFPLNFLKTNSEEKKAVSEVKEENIQEPHTPKLKLNFLKNEKEDLDNNHKTDSLQNSDTKNEEIKEIKLDFLKDKTNENQTIQEDTQDHKITLNFLKDDASNKSDKDIPNNTIKENNKDYQQTENISLNLIKEDTIFNEKLTKDQESKTDKLSFLNINSSEDVHQTPEENIQINKSQIIKQIKEDIKEIDSETEKQTEKKLFKLEEPKEVDVNLDKSDLTVPVIDTSITNNSFVDTLKGLFDEKREIKQVNKEIESNRSDKVFSFKLKQHNKSIQKDNKIDIINTNDIKQDEQQIEKSSYPSLKSLGLDPVQERDLLSDFITDAKESINSISYFIEINDFDKIKYSLVKIKSSAEILNLDDIIQISNTMKGNCEDSNLKQIEQNQKILSDKIEQLEQHLAKIIV